MLINENNVNVRLPLSERIWLNIKDEGDSEPCVSELQMDAESNSWNQHISLNMIFGRVMEYAAVVKNCMSGAQVPTYNNIAGSISRSSSSSTNSTILSTPSMESTLLRFEETQPLFLQLERQLNEWWLDLPLRMRKPGTVFGRKNSPPKGLAVPEDLPPLPSPVLPAAVANAFPSTISSSTTAKSTVIATNDIVPPPPWEVAYLHIFYHTTRVILHRPRLMILLQQSSSSLSSTSVSLSTSQLIVEAPTPTTKITTATPSTNVFHHPSYINSVHAASETSTILKTVMTSNPKFRCFTSMICFCIFQTALVHVVTAQVLRKNESSSGDAHQSSSSSSSSPSSPSSSPYPLDLHQRELMDARTKLDIHIQALKSLSGTWIAAERLHSLLEELALSSIGF